MSNKTGLQDLLEEASVKYSIPLSLLEKILNEERARLYLFDSSRASVIDDIRAMIQENVTDANNEA